MRPDSIVITGMGAVSPNGIGVSAFGDALFAGRSGLKYVEGIDPALVKTRVCGQISREQLNLPDHLPERELRRMPRCSALAIVAAREALAMAAWAPDQLALEQRLGTGVFLGTGGGGQDFQELQYQLGHRGELKKLSPFVVSAGTMGNACSEISIYLGLRGPSHVITSGCTSSSDAIGHASMFLRDGQCEVALVGGADAPITTGVLVGFELMKIVPSSTWSTPAEYSRPFSRSREGLVLAEGAWMLVLETAEHAQRRGATILAEVAGYCSTCDAFHRVQINPDLEAPLRAIKGALQRAGVGTHEVDYVNLHGTATPMNDVLETNLMKLAFNSRAEQIPMSATKSVIGHPQGACGAAATVACVLSMQRGQVHPTLNLTDPDEQCNLDYVPLTARPAQVDVAVVNCMGFGSKNSVLVLKRPGA